MQKLKQPCAPVVKKKPAANAEVNEEDEAGKYMAELADSDVEDRTPSDLHEETGALDYHKQFSMKLRVGMGAA